MDLFGFKKRRRAREERARQRAAALQAAIDSVPQRPDTIPVLVRETPGWPPRGRRRYAEVSENYPGFIPPQSGMIVDNNHAAWANDPTPAPERSSHNFGAAGSGLPDLGGGLSSDTSSNTD